MRSYVSAFRKSSFAFDAFCEGMARVCWLSLTSNGGVFSHPEVLCFLCMLDDVCQVVISNCRSDTECRKCLKASKTLSEIISSGKKENDRHAMED